MGLVAKAKLSPVHLNMDRKTAANPRIKPEFGIIAIDLPAFRSQCHLCLGHWDGYSKRGHIKTTCFTACSSALSPKTEVTIGTEVHSTYVTSLANPLTTNLAPEVLLVT
jgi:hypothetical protein